MDQGNASPKLFPWLQASGFWNNVKRTEFKKMPFLFFPCSTVSIFFNFHIMSRDAPSWKPWLCNFMEKSWEEEEKNLTSSWIWNQIIQIGSPALKKDQCWCRWPKILTLIQKLKKTMRRRFLKVKQNSMILQQMLGLTITNNCDVDSLSAVKWSRREQSKLKVGYFLL